MASCTAATERSSPLLTLPVFQSTTSHFRNGEKAVAPSRLYQLCAQFLPTINGATVLSDTPIPEGKNPLKENPITGNWPNHLLAKLFVTPALGHQLIPGLNLLD